MRTSSWTNILLFIVGIVSILAQGLLFIPEFFEFILKYLPPWGNITFGAALFILGIFSYIAVSHQVLPKMSVGRHTSSTLLATQAFTIAGILFLFEYDASHAREVGFALGGIVTILTTYGVFLTIKQFKTSPNTIPLKNGSGEETLFVIDPGTPINALNEQIASLTRQLAAEKRRTTQLLFLNELSQQLEAELDPPVAAQLAVNTLEKTMECSMALLMMHDPENQGYIVLASAGTSANIIPSGYHQQPGTGLLGRTVRLKKTQIVNDTRIDPDFIPLKNETTLSAINVPIIQHGHVLGVFEIRSDKSYAFSAADAALVESAASELVRAWERSSYQHHITELIQAGIDPSTLMMDPQASAQEIAMIARKTLQAQFVFVHLLDQQGSFSRTAFSGNAPKLQAAITNHIADNPLIQATLNATSPFRVRDIRKYSGGQKIDIDHSGLRSALAIPVRIHRFSIGAIIAFGKQESTFFSEKDESLADLLSSQAGYFTESSWLIQESNRKDMTSNLLNDLSLKVIQTEDLNHAAKLIAQAAHTMTNAKETGIVLMMPDGQVEAEVELDAEGFHSRHSHPMGLIEQAIKIGEHIEDHRDENDSLICYPLLTHRRTYGALWWNNVQSGQNFVVIKMLANQAAIALERTVLLAESRKQAKQIEEAYEELEVTYDRTLTALMSALDARDRETEGHSTRVSRLACLLAEEIGLTGSQLKALERGSLLHDIGKIGISDTILHKPGKLTDKEWETMRVHPDIGARIVEGIPFLQDTLSVIRYHHERWDGSGYPIGLKGKDIPIQARIFAVVDVFDALTSKRSYRKKSSPEEALEYLREQADKLFDLEIVEAFARLPYKDFIEAEKTVV
jgi:putative nucleotidyltransferase with HDIG domain